MAQELNIALIGCGKMGSALLQGWLDARIAQNIHILKPSALPEEFDDFTPDPIKTYQTAEDFVKAGPNADIFVLAVKPQIMEEVCRSVAEAVPHNALIITIAAGQPIANFENWFGATQPIVRAMPNTPASIHKGITGAVTNDYVTQGQKKAADAMLKAVGDVVWVDHEDKMDMVTAISGSGPAYYFQFAEAITQAGEEIGLSPEESARLARATFQGAAALSEAQKNIPLETLRKNVTSPGGTTEAALNEMNKDDRLQKVVTDGVKAALRRGKELSR